MAKGLLRRNSMNLGTIAVAIALTLGSSFAHAQESLKQYRPKVGDVHPEIRLPNISDRSEVALSDYRGKKVLLIHFASW